MKLSARVFLLLMFCLLVQCSKRATVVDSSFIGVWMGTTYGATYKLSIDNESNAFWVEDNNGHYEKVQGIARITGDELRIGYKKFQINEYPTLDTATNTWLTVLSGITYSRNP